MNLEAQAGAGHGPSRRMFSTLGRLSSRIALCGALVLGLGTLAAGGLAAGASAAPVQHGDHAGGRANGFGFVPGRGGAGSHSRSVTGEVTGILISGSEFSVVTARGATFNVYVDVSTTTTYTEPGVPSGTTVGFSSIAVGDNVRVRGRAPSSGTIDANNVTIPRATVSGTVQSLPTGQIVLDPTTSSLTSNSATIVVDVSGASYKGPGVTSASASPVQVGDTVKVKGLQLGLQSGDLTVQATSVDIPLVTYKGTIGNWSTSGFTLTSTSSTVSVTVSVTSGTKYRVERAGYGSSAVDGISNGEYAEVTGEQNGTDNVIATLVEVMGTSHGRGHGRGYGSGGPGPSGWGSGRGGSGGSGYPRGGSGLGGGSGSGSGSGGFGRGGFGGFGGSRGGHGRR